jgi:hypothetical protein
MKPRDSRKPLARKKRSRYMKSNHSHHCPVSSDLLLYADMQQRQERDALCNCFRDKYVASCTSWLIGQPWQKLICQECTIDVVRNIQQNLRIIYKEAMWQAAWLVLPKLEKIIKAAPNLASSGWAKAEDRSMMGKIQVLLQDYQEYVELCAKSAAILAQRQRVYLRELLCVARQKRLDVSRELMQYQYEDKTNLEVLNSIDTQRRLLLRVAVAVRQNGGVASSFEHLYGFLSQVSP